MKRRMILVCAALLTSGCSPEPDSPRPVHKSLYLNKRLLKFVLDNGSPYREKPLTNGRTLHYWRSDFGSFFAPGFGREDRNAPPCELILETDSRQTIRRIFILRRSIACLAALK